MFKSFTRDERGSSMIEMVLVLAVMGIVMVTLLTFGKSFIFSTTETLSEKIVEINTPTDTNNTSKDDITDTTNTTTTTNENTKDNTNNTTNGSTNNDSIENKIEKEYYVE